MRYLFFGLFIYILIVSVIFHDFMNIYSTSVGVLSACVLSGIGLGNLLGEIVLRNQEERDW